MRHDEVPPRFLKRSEHGRNGATNQENAESPVVPEELALLPIFNNIVYPLTMIPLAIGQEPASS